MNSLWYVLVFGVAAVITLVTTPLVIKLAKRFDIIDYPDGRRVNDKPTPRPGGIALFLGIILSLGILALIFALDPNRNVASYGLTKNVNYFGVALSAAIIFAVGLIDDIRNIRVRYKVLGQIVAAIVACFSGVLLSQIDNPVNNAYIHLGIFAYPITIFYLVAFANIINLIDGLDGLAAGIVTISCVALFIISLGKGGLDAALVATAIAGACVAFLRYNSYPARVFMGDSGALLLGFLLGVVSLFGAIRTPALITLSVPVVIAGIPVLDTLTSIIRRLRAGRSIADADKSHIHHRFLALGYDQKTTVYIIYVLSGLLSLCALMLNQYKDWMRWVILAVILIMVALLVWRLGLTDPILKHHYNKRTTDKTSLDNDQDNLPPP